MALGGHAFVEPGHSLTMAGQQARAREAVGVLLDAIGVGTSLVVTHGNGPQVGHALTRVELALGEAYEIPLEVCVAETEGELGYVLAQTLHNELAARGRRRPVASLLTQVLVDPNDPAFEAPTKPIGPVYPTARADALEDAGFVVMADRGGWRRAVASPEPLEILDVDVVGRLLDMDVTVIAAGGGGVPVVERAGRIEGIEGVIDKDLASAMLAREVGADALIIVTDVPCAYLGFGTEDPRPLRRASGAEARALAAEGHFGEGSMAPKIEAGARFAEAGGRTVITDLAQLEDALAGRAGTTIEEAG